MKLDEYSESVLNKAATLLKRGLIRVEYPKTEQQMLATVKEGKNWHFFVSYGEDKNGRKGEYYVDKNGDKGNLVLYNASKDIWICSCLHYIMSGGSDNCKHVCACRLRQQKIIEELEGENGKNKYEQDGKSSNTEGSQEKAGVDSPSGGDTEDIPSGIEQAFGRRSIEIG